MAIRFVFAVGALAVIAGCSKGGRTTAAEPQYVPLAAIPITAADDGYKLRLKLQVGDKLVYEFHSHERVFSRGPEGTTGQSGWVETDIRAEVEQECVGISDGVYVINSKYINPAVTVTCTGGMKGKEERFRNNNIKTLRRQVTLRFDDRFRDPVSLSEDSDLGVYFPEDRIKIGDKWRKKVAEATRPDDPAAMLKGMMPTYEFVLEGVDAIGEWQTVRIAAHLLPTAVATDEGHATTWYDIESGVMVRSIISMELNAPSVTEFSSEMYLKSFIRGGASAGE